MNELEMALALGILPDPIQNRVCPDTFLQSDVAYLSHVFRLSRAQKEAIGTVNPDVWCELLPWHSMN